MLLETGILALALLAQSPPPTVRTVGVSGVACTRDGWCTELPGPLDVATAGADARRVVAGSTGGVLVLHDGTWLGGVDSGLGKLVHIELEADLVRACDAERCVKVPLASGRFGEAVPDGAPPPGSRAPGQQTSSGSFGEGGRYELGGERVRAFANGQRVLSRDGVGALGAAGAPLWVVHGSAVTRYTADEKSPVGRQERFPISCAVWCDGWNGRLFGGADAPFLQLHHHAGEGLYHFEGERFAPLHSPGLAAYKEPTQAVLGEGCSPCVVGAWQVAIRRPDRWVIVSFPRVNAPAATRARAIGLDAEGWPTLRLNLAHLDEPERLEAWAFDGSQWKKGASASTVRVPWRDVDPSAKSPTWTGPRQRGVRGCTARTPWGESWSISGAGLTATGSRQRRVERLPQETSLCEVVPGEAGVFILDGLRGGALSKRWEDLALGEPAEPGRFRVVDVAQDDVLHVRRGPDPAAGSVARLAPGACVEGRGLRTLGRGGAWLKVGPEGAAEGWASARYLKAEPCTP